MSYSSFAGEEDFLKEFPEARSEHSNKLINSWSFLLQNLASIGTNPCRSSLEGLISPTVIGCRKETQKQYGNIDKLGTIILLCSLEVKEMKHSLCWSLKITGKLIQNHHCIKHFHVR